MTQYTHIMKKEENLLIDTIAVANRRKEYVEKLYGKEENTDQLVVDWNHGTIDLNENIGILKS